MGIIEENVVNVVLKDGRLVDGGKVAACEYVEERGLAACAISSKDSVCQRFVWSSFDCVKHGTASETYRSTNFRDTVFELPQSGIVGVVKPRVVVRDNWWT